MSTTTAANRLDDLYRLRDRVDAEIAALESGDWLRTTIARVGREYGIHPATILGRDRTAYVCSARRVLCRVLRDQQWTLTRIGAALDRHYASVMHALATITDDELATVARIERQAA